MEDPNDKPLTPVPPPQPLKNAGIGDDTRIFQVSRARKTALWCLMIPLAAAFGFAIYFPYIPNVEIDRTEALLIQVLFGGGGFLFLAFLYAAMNNRIEVDLKEIRAIGITGTDRMAFENLAGFRVIQDENTRHLALEPKPDSGERLNVSLNVTYSDQLLALMRSRVPDLDAADLATDLSEIYENKAIGKSPEDGYRQAFRRRNEEQFLLFDAFTLGTDIEAGGRIGKGLVYNEYTEGSAAVVKERTGMLGIPYFFVR